MFEFCFCVILDWQKKKERNVASFKMHTSMVSIVKDVIRFFAKMLGSLSLSGKFFRKKREKVGQRGRHSFTLLTEEVI